MSLPKALRFSPRPKISPLRGKNGERTAGDPILSTAMMRVVGTQKGDVPFHGNRQVAPAAVGHLVENEVAGLTSTAID